MLIPLCFLRCLAMQFTTLLAIAVAAVAVNAGKVEFFRGDKNCNGSPTNTMTTKDCNVCFSPPGGQYSLSSFRRP